MMDLEYSEIQFAQPYGVRPGHPWLRASEWTCSYPEKPCILTINNPQGEPLGTGLFDPRDPVAVWRRFSLAGGASFDESYLVSAIEAALSRRTDENCQRLIFAEGDYLPGLEVDLYGDLLVVTSTHALVDRQMEVVVDYLKEICRPSEVVFLDDDPRRVALGLGGARRTLSGCNLKARWIEVDGLAYRLDLWDTAKACFALDQREQHALVGSLCEGRRILVGDAQSGAFALQAARAGATHVLSLDGMEVNAKSIGAHAQKNGVFVETEVSETSLFLDTLEVGAFEGIVFDAPPLGKFDLEGLRAQHKRAFACLPESGLLATYLRSSDVDAVAFERLVGEAATEAGREARIFARTAQPFDFPILINFPESAALKGLILQVE